ncbi:MAG: tRNA pseudouridine(13) synthase TruD [gamma proteobacterium symbiont of Bathyaustriella thionipta]|nr:tRNA pseudouridine(13) synthase TruD [gamma proteobacterium symbiont of Bathyaustriella thionipta]MCU7949609.1 tRNA pseudouridine(13) synthase TruD [gamma proteobacterium symbiont of Bathyaustriella thionipta]MCU7956201.1 tRNA pseudouridine(13) synthase TruD [gamma proteobacterium symbiont of Bathyaustriella thionipta]MCU7968501.1 tRNA pseudouridine(13) synthase TruD [gamma proteobacterium symbiont of Bathyaustriella thionipta]
MNETDLDLSEPYPVFKIEDLAYAHDVPEGMAKFKVYAADFIVRETLSFEPEGKGTHAYLYIEKTNTNTEWLARQLARFVGVEAREIGYAGLKDRNAVTSQWFSINLEITDEPDWDEFQLEGVKILKKTLHRKKLKRGAIKHNDFEIVLRDLEQLTREELSSRINKIQSSGVPNYFAQQRFGHDYNNLTRGAKWFDGAIKIKKRADKSMILSAARSMIFNQMLSHRIQQKGWDKLINGDIMMLSGTHSIFPAAEIDDELQARFHQGDIHPTAALWGRGRLSSENDLLTIEQSVADMLVQWCEGLEKQGLKQERRAARLFPENLSIQFTEDSLEKVTLAFSLPTGTYATAVLREIIRF